MDINQYSPIYEEAAQQYKLDPELLMAQGQFESSGNPNAIGEPTKYGQAQGLAQMIPATAQALGITDPTDPRQSIFGQAKLMRENLDRYGDNEKALMAYHGGTNEKNWGPKTQAYPANVYKFYKQKTSMQPASSQQIVEEDIDPVEYARSKIAEQNKTQGTPNAVGEEDIDPVEYARSKIAEQEAQEKNNPPPRKVDIGEDLGLTAISAPIKGVGALTQIPQMAGNAVANAVGYSYGKLAGATPEQQEKLNNLNPFFTGNTSADALWQAGKAVIDNDPTGGQANPLTGAVLHDPQHPPAKYMNALIQAGIAGPQTGLKILPSLTGAAGAEAASEAFPNNPLATAAGALAGGTTPSAIKSIKLRPSPEELANKVIQDKMDNKLMPSGNFSYIKENPIIPGIKNTLAEVTEDPNIALMQRQAESKNPGFKAREVANEGVREQYFDKAAGSRQDVETMKTQREAQREVDTKAIFKPGQVAKATPVIKKIDEILNGPGGERSAVKNTLTRIREMIAKDKDGAVALEKNPEKLYRSVKHEIEDMMDKKNLNNPEGRQASYELNQVKQVLDEVIEAATPGYKKYLDNYSKASAKIDAAQWLQDLKLTDAGGSYTLAKVKNALENAKKQQRSRGIQDAKHLTPDQMQTLENLHDDLLRRETPMRRSMDRGSPTKQNLLAEADMQSSLAKSNEILGIPTPEVMGTSAGAALSHLSGIPGGAYFGSLAGRLAGHMSKQRMAAANTNLENFILDPQAYKNYLLNGTKENYATRFLNNMLTERP